MQKVTMLCSGHTQSAEHSFLMLFCAISGAFQVMCGVKGVEEARQKSGVALDREAGAIRTWYVPKPKVPQRDRCVGYFKNCIIR